MRIPMLASILIFIIFIIFLNIIFINSNKLEQDIFSSLYTVRGKVLGASEQLVATLPVSQPIIEVSPTIPEKLPNIEDFNLLADSGAVIDCQSQTLLFNKSADQSWPIASITKLMTALVFLDHNPGWELIYKVKKEDIRNGGRIYLIIGDEIKVRDLFYLSLVSSANTATIALVHSTGLSVEEFTREMNKKANELNLKNTNFIEPTGLSHLNVSTAAEITKFAQVALASEDISQASLTKQYNFTTNSGREQTVYNTDVLLEIFPQNGVKILGGKTGYLKVAGYCFISKFASEAGHEIITVVLGAESDKARFDQTKELVDWVYENYQW